MIFKNKSYNLFILIIFIISLLWSGGYYEYISAVIGAFLAVYIIVYCRKRSVYIKLNEYVVVTAIITFMYIVSSFYAVDFGMALTGVAKKCPVFLFALVLTTVEKEDKKRIISIIPEISAVLTLIASILAIIPSLRHFIIKAGRFCGTFGYANTYALFVLLSIIILLGTFHKRKSVINFVIMAVLLAGMWFSGSRYTWILAFICLFIYACHKKDMRRYTYIILAILTTATVCAGTLFSHSKTIGRFFSTNFSTLYGRLLYWQDGLLLAAKHPFGIGYLGYYYKQTQIQTGVYTVRYIHNDWLQLMLDIGWIPLLMAAIFLFKILCGKSHSFVSKLLVFTIAVHSFMEFDMEHTGIVFFLMLIISCNNENIFERKDIKLNSHLLKDASALLGVFCIYFSIPLCLYAIGDMKKADNIYPIYTEAQLANLSVESDDKKALKIADKILSQNDTAFLAYDAKAKIAWNKLDYSEMVYYKKEAIKRNKFDYNEYSDYLIMLNEALSYFIENEDNASVIKVVADMRDLLEMIKNNKAKVSKLGEMIDDKVKIDLPDDIVSQIEALGD